MPLPRPPVMEPAATDVPDLTSTDERTIVDLRGIGPLVCLGRYRYLTAHESVGTQRHARLVVLVLPVRGSFDFVVGGEGLRIGVGDVLRIPAGTAYRSGRRAEGRGELLWVIAHASEGSPGPDPGDAAELARAVDELARGRVSVSRAPDSAVPALTAALDAPKDDRWMVRARRRHLCAAVLLDLVTEDDGAVRGPSTVHPAVRRAQVWIEAHLDEPVTVDRLSRVLGLSHTQLHEAFVTSIGTSPKDYVLRVKLERAKALLRSGSLGITDVAHQLGFSSSQQFARVFRRYEGVSPSRWRDHGD